MGFLDVDLLPAYYLIGHHVFPPLKEDPERRNDEGGDANNDHIQQEKDGVLDNPQEGLILLVVKHHICSSLYQKVKKVRQVKAEGGVVEEVVDIVLGYHLGRRLGVSEQDFRLVSHGKDCPRDYCRHHKGLNCLICQQSCSKIEGLPNQHVNVIGHISNTSCVPFSLPKTSLNICEISFPCLDIHLVERCVNRVCFDLALAFPECLDCCMKIFSYGIRAGVPEPYPLYKVEAEAIVGEGKTSIKNRNEVRVVHTGVKLIKRPSDNWNFQVIPCVYLIWHIDESLSPRVVAVSSHVIFDFLDVDRWHPRIGINYRQEHAINIDAVGLEKILLQVLSTP